MRILITGAHFTPAVAVVEELKKRDGLEIIYVGRSATMEGDNTLSQEAQVLPKLGVRFISITTGRLQRFLSPYFVISLLKIPIGIIQSIYIILSEKPDVILSFGGYVAVPVVIIGWFFSVPIIVHEQTLISGLANRISSHFADKIAVSFEKASPKNEKVVLTGNPLREEILHPIQISGEYKKFLNLARDLKLPIILVTGGNQGSHVINLSLEEVLEKLTKIACVIHVTGDNKFDDFERLEKLGRSGKLGRLGERYLVRKWIGEEWATVLSKVDLVVSRAGINTLSELAFVGKPALVIPISYLYFDEQNKNAKYFKNLGLVKILSQSGLSSESLIKNIKAMLNDLNRLTENAKKARTVIIPDAAKRLALEVLLLINPGVTHFLSS